LKEERMSIFSVRSPLQYDGQLYLPGATVAMASADEAAALVKLGVLEAPAEESPPAEVEEALEQPSEPVPEKLPIRPLINSRRSKR